MSCSSHSDNSTKNMSEIVAITVAKEKKNTRYDNYRGKSNRNKYHTIIIVTICT